MENLTKIGIDFGSMLIYLVNYGLLLGVLAYFVYPKILKIIDERREQIKSNLDESARLRSEMSKQVETHKADREQLLSELESDREALKSELQKTRTELVAKMDQERSKLLEETRAQLSEEKKSIIKDAETQVVSMIERVIMKILSNQVEEQVVKKSVQESWKSLNK